MTIKPQPGFQEKVFGCTADIAFVGGSAGGGKTMSLIVEPLKWIEAPEFAAVFFRRDKERIRATGGLLAESKKWYIEGELKERDLKWCFPSGAQVDFEGIEYMKDLDKWLGTQIPLIIFDEVTEFEEQMFWFMVSRNRGIVTWKSKDGKKYMLKPYVRASCNPKPNSWVARLLDWYIDQDTGFPIEERDGKLRYFLRWKDRMYWGNSKEEVIASCPDAINSMFKIDPSIKPQDLIKSFTFIRGKLSDNKILTSTSPEYYSSLLSMSDADQKRFLEGNWKIASDGTELFEFASLRKLFHDADPPFAKTYISCDAAKFGQDLCTIYVWQGWTVVAISIFHLSDIDDICREIEYLRDRFQVKREDVIVDQDGLGGDVVKKGRYKGFMARRKAVETDETVENYRSFKDQCYFHAAEKVNSGECKFFLMSSTVRIFDRGSKKVRFSKMIRWKGDLVSVEILIVEHLSAIKKADTVFDGGESKYAINSKEEQKEILQGISPDLADPVCMRAAFDLEKKRRGIAKIH